MERKYRAVYDASEFIDSIDCASFEEAKETVMDILSNWMEACMVDHFGDPDEWNRMIMECTAWVEEYEEDTDYAEDIWYPSDEALEQIGWVAVEEDD